MAHAVLGVVGRIQLKWIVVSDERHARFDPIAHASREIPSAVDDTDADSASGSRTAGSRVHHDHIMAGHAGRDCSMAWARYASSGIVTPSRLFIMCA